MMSRNPTPDKWIIRTVALFLTVPIFVVRLPEFLWHMLPHPHLLRRLSRRFDAMIGVMEWHLRGIHLP
jgi:hypothetical protein